jgi:glycerol uptake facilitator-like aquaporin
MQQKCIAEFIGAATLSFAVLASLSLTTPLIITPVVAGLVLLLFVYTIGSISGAHINPAVTIGAWSIKKISTKDAAMYVVAQCLGGFAAFLLATSVLTGTTMGFATESYSDFWAEFIGMVIFTFGIASVIYGKTTDAAAGVVIGGSLLLGIMLAVAAGSAGILNPAVGIALGMVSLSNIAGAILGSVVGMHLYRYLVR